MTPPAQPRTELEAALRDAEIAQRDLAKLRGPHDTDALRARVAEARRHNGNARAELAQIDRERRLWRFYWVSLVGLSAALTELVVFRWPM